MNKSDLLAAGANRWCLIDQLHTLCFEIIQGGLYVVYFQADMVDARPAFRQIAGDAAVFAAPRDAAAIAAAIETVWTDERKRDDLRSRGRERVARFSWEASARKALELYRTIGGAA